MIVVENKNIQKKRGSILDLYTGIIKLWALELHYCAELQVLD